jgi:hypothetical protein
LEEKLPIVFYSYFHNGDVFFSKPFIKQIMETIPVKFYYAHRNHPKILMDVDIQQIMLQQSMPMHSNKVIRANNACLVNTWIGAHFPFGVPGNKEGSCTIGYSYGMYELIYDQLNKIYGSNLKLNEDIKSYFSYINFDKFDLSKVKKYLSQDSRKKILISNNPGLSNQCSYNGNMQDIVEHLASSFKDISFICTLKFTTNHRNIFFTDDINQENQCDLNEISYLSKFCDIIVGRSSGPFSFSLTRENIQDYSKVFICFGDRITDCYQHNVKTNSKFVFEKILTQESLLNTIKNEINEFFKL